MPDSPISSDLLLLALMDLFGHRRDVHKHQCPKCGEIWEHMTPPPEATEEDYEKAHACARCGTQQRMKYFERKF